MPHKSALVLTSLNALRLQYVGLSEIAASAVRKVHAIVPVAAVEIEVSLWAEKEAYKVIDAAKELDIAIIAYSPLGRGFLSGKFKSKDDLPKGDMRSHTPMVSRVLLAGNTLSLRYPDLVLATRSDFSMFFLLFFFLQFQPENWEKNKALVDTLHELAKKRGCTAAQLALAWVLSLSDKVCHEDNISRIQATVRFSDGSKEHSLIGRFFFICHGPRSPDHSYSWLVFRRENSRKH